MEADFETLSANLDALDKTADRTAAAAEGKMTAFEQTLAVRAHYHRLLMKCAARMSVEDFATAIKAAEPGPLADDTEEARR